VLGIIIAMAVVHIYIYTHTIYIFKVCLQQSNYYDFKSVIESKLNFSSKEFRLVLYFFGRSQSYVARP